MQEKSLLSVGKMGGRAFSDCVYCSAKGRVPRLDKVCVTRLRGKDTWGGSACLCPRGQTWRMNELLPYQIVVQYLCWNNHLKSMNKCILWSLTKQEHINRNWKCMFQTQIQTCLLWQFVRIIWRSKRHKNQKADFILGLQVTTRMGLSRAHTSAKAQHFPSVLTKRYQLTKLGGIFQSFLKIPTLFPETLTGKQMYQRHVCVVLQISNKVSS